AEGQPPRLVRRRGLHEDRVGRPGTGRAEGPWGVEVAERHELRLASPECIPKTRHGVEGHPAETPVVLGGAERMAAQMEPAHEGEWAEALGLAHHLADEGCRLAATRRQQDAHARTEPSDRLLDADRAGHAARAPISPDRPARGE